MSDTAREFLKSLAEEEKFFLSHLTKDRLGIGLLTAIKEFDHYFFHRTRNPASEESEDLFHIMRMGLPSVVSGYLGLVPEFIHPMLTFKSDDLLVQAALQMVSALGLIEQGNRMAHGALAGECDVLRVNERFYDVVLPDLMFNMEQHEAQVEKHYTRLYRAHLDAASKKAFTKTDAEHIDRLLTENVYVFRESFIGYDAHPDLDDYFFGLAAAELELQPGYDTYDWRVRFGGLTMQKYILAATFFLSLALKHERFAEALVKKVPAIRLRDVLTITKDKAELEFTLREALNRYGTAYEGFEPVTEEEARTLIRVLSVRRDNLEILSGSMAPLPFLIEFSETAWITSTSTVQLGAMRFLLDSLRYNFSKDYDRNQQGREGSMQRALQRLLGEYLPGIKCVANVKLRANGKVRTDIDFIAADEVNGTALLFQFKHQDHYGGDMKRRSTRSARLRKEFAHWISAVRTWSDESDAATFSSALQLRKDFARQKVRFVAIGRHFAHFLSTSDIRDDVVYATWIQLFDALNRMVIEKKSLDLSTLFDVLDEYMSHKKARAVELDVLDSYHLQNMSYRVRPASAAGVPIKMPGQP